VQASKPANQTSQIPEERKALWTAAIRQILVALEADNFVATRTLADGVTLEPCDYIDLKALTCIMSATVNWTVGRTALTSPKSLLNLVGTVCERLKEFTNHLDDSMLLRLQHFGKQLLQASTRYGGWSSPAPTCSEIHKNLGHLKKFSNTLVNFLDNFSPAMTEAVFSVTLATHTDHLIDEKLSKLATHGPYRTKLPLGLGDGTCDSIGAHLANLRSNSETRHTSQPGTYTTRTAEQLKLMRAMDVTDSLSENSHPHGDGSDSNSGNSSPNLLEIPSNDEPPSRHHATDLFGRPLQPLKSREQERIDSSRYTPSSDIAQRMAAARPSHISPPRATQHGLFQLSPHTPPLLIQSNRPPRNLSQNSSLSQAWTPDMNPHTMTAHLHMRQPAINAPASPQKSADSLQPQPSQPSTIINAPRPQPEPSNHEIDSSSDKSLEPSPEPSPIKPRPNPEEPNKTSNTNIGLWGIQQRGTCDVSTLFKQENATNPNDDYLIGTPFEPFAKICLENHQPSFEQCKNIDFIHSFLKQHYKHGWKPREQGDPVYMNIEGMYYNCTKHKQTPLGNCQCLPKCPACNHGQHIKIYNRPIDKGKPQTDKQMRHGYCVPTLTPILVCPRWTAGVGFPLIGTFNEESKVICPAQKGEEEWGQYRNSSRFASEYLKQQIFDIASLYAGKPRQATSAMKLLTTRNITKSTVAFCLMARTFRKHQTGYDLQNPKQGRYDSTKSLEDIFGPVKSVAKQIDPDQAHKVAALMAAFEPP
jgi:hypothetical protein